jgi:transcriptional regulator with XRE-family HTH domain
MNKIRDEAVLKKFGQKIKQLRKEHGMSQYDLSVECDIEKTQIYRIEGAKINPTLSTLVALARAFDLTLEELLRDVPYKK